MFDGILIVDGGSARASLAARLIQLGMGHIVAVCGPPPAQEPKPTAESLEVLYSDSTSFYENAKNALMDVEQCRPWNMEEIRQGIQDCIEQLAHRVAMVLAVHSEKRALPGLRPLHQPCWRAGRWKSLT